ncbi:MAG: potassium channel family protein, partial [Acidimicrobiia bacterium]
VKKTREERWFSDEGKSLDRFGLVLGLSALSVAVLALIDLDDVSEGLRSEFASIIVTITVGLTLVFALRASGVAKRPRRVAEIVVVLIVVGIFAFTFLDGIAGVQPSQGLDLSRPSYGWTLITMLSPIVVLRRVMKHETVTMQTLFGAVAVYMLLALAFNYAFLAVDNVGGGSPFFANPESTSSFMYFSLSTITTVGYGDLTAVSDTGRFLASAEAVLGQIFLVMVVARLVSLYSMASVTSVPRGEQGETTAVE